MKLDRNGWQLRIIVGEASRCHGHPLYEWLVVKAREYGLAGATVYRGMMGYGANSRIKTTSILRLSEDLPVIIELVDERTMLEQFFDLVEAEIAEGLVTLSPMEIQLYRPGRR